MGNFIIRRLTGVGGSGAGVGGAPTMRPTTTLNVSAIFFYEELPRQQIFKTR